MKKLTIIFILFCLATMSSVFAQSNGKKQTANEDTYHRKKITRTTKTVRSKAEMDSIRKETAPIQNDNGTENTTGIVDGSRSSTGRPGADTTVSYTVRKRKKVIQTGGVIIPDTTKKKK
jgi:activator of 2-hydroxyglutaryl-CoA dehydratase